MRYRVEWHYDVIEKWMEDFPWFWTAKGAAKFAAKKAVHKDSTCLWRVVRCHDSIVILNISKP